MPYANCPSAACPIPRVAAIHDLSGFGRTSLTVAIPVLSSLGIQVCPLPTAVLSSQTSDVDDFCFVDLSTHMQDFLEHWKRLGLTFDAVYSGFLGSAGQAAVIRECIESCLIPGGLALVDPVLGDNGSLDPTMTPDIVKAMSGLIRHAHCITPNITEAAFLLKKTYPERPMPVSQMKEWLHALSALGPERVVITSAPLAGFVGKTVVVAFDARQNRYWKVVGERIPVFYPGTGDTFASVLCGSLLLGESLPSAMDRAARFVTRGIRATFGHNLPGRNGILLERVLPTLQAPLTNSTYSLQDE